VRCAPWCIHCCSTARDLRVGVGLGVVHACSRHATTESGNGRYASDGIGQRMLKAANRATSILRSRYQGLRFQLSRGSTRKPAVDCGTNASSSPCLERESGEGWVVPIHRDLASQAERLPGVPPRYMHRREGLWT
jgi:hypothetical protein